tara:strand:+ start:136 stop:405 length:270 start_codon:yes stop_codon:yes gene_type:complete
MTKARFFNNFVILNDFLEGYDATSEEQAKAKELKFTDFFMLYDDDDVLYYSGYMSKDIEDEFEPLDWGMYDSGCTYMKYRAKDGKMEIL